MFFKKDGTYTEWSKWSGCSKNCGNDSVQTRTREYIPGKYGGTKIEKSKQKLEETRICPGLPPCKDGSYSAWAPLNICITKLKDDKLIEERNYIPAGIGGIDIPPNDRILRRETPCGDEVNLNDRFTNWVDVSGSICRKEQNRSSEQITCGTGWKEQERIYHPAQSGGITTITNPNDTTQWIPCTAAKPICQIKDGKCTEWSFSGQCVNDFAQFSRKYIPPVDGGKGHECATNLTSNTLNGISYHCGKLENLVDSGCIGAHNKQIKTIKRKYTLPSKYNGQPIRPHNEEITSLFNSATIDQMYSLKLNSSFKTSTNPIYTITKIQVNPDIIEYQYEEECPKLPLSLDTITNIWKNQINCNTDIKADSVFVDLYDSNKEFNLKENPNDSNSIRYLTEADARDKLSKFNLDYIIRKQNTSTNFDNLINMVSRCTNPSRVVSNPNTFQSKNILYPGLCYKNFTLTSGKYRLTIGTSIYNFALFYDNKEYWSHKTDANSSNNICMQADGNLVIYKNNTMSDRINAIWSTKTHNNPGAYLELLNSGFLVIRNKNKKIIKLIPEPHDNSLVKNYIKTRHWDGSPWVIMMDYNGRAWEVAPRAFGGFFNTNKATFDEKKSWTNSGKMDNFNGWTASHKDKFWTGENLSKRLNLNSIGGYKTILNDEYPSLDNDSTVYWRDEDVDRFVTATNRSIKDKLPSDINGNTLTPPVELPGYQRISFKTDNARTLSKVIKCDRGASRNDTGFLVFSIHTDKDTYADNIVSLHPKLIFDIVLWLTGLKESEFDTNYRNSIQNN